MDSRKSEKNPEKVSSWKPRAKGFQGGRIIGQLVKGRLQVIEYTALKLTTGVTTYRSWVTPQGWFWWKGGGESLTKMR